MEIGGTVGDIESLPFLEAIRQLRNEVGRDNMAFVHVSLIPEIGPTQELKTKPTQHSVKELRSIGIQPDIIVCRSEQPVPENERSKIALFTNVSKPDVISLPDTNSIYEVPIMLTREGLGARIAEKLGLPMTT